MHSPICSAVSELIIYRLPLYSWNIPDYGTKHSLPCELQINNAWPFMLIKPAEKASLICFKNLSKNGIGGVSVILETVLV